MSNNTRWNKNEELELIKDICKGVPLNDIATKHNRSSSAIELRLKKIIYENVISGKSLSEIASILSMDEERIRQYFYSYKDFREKHKLSTHDITNNITHDVVSIECKNKDMNTNNNQNSNSNNIMVGGRIDKSNSKIEHELNKLELENKALRLILENKMLTSKINKLIKEGSLDKDIKKIIKNIREQK